MLQRIFILVLTGVIGSYYTYAQSISECDQKSLFSPMPNHEARQCEIKEFDSYSITRNTENGNYESFNVEGEVHKVSYDWKGEWSKRPSNVQIYRNYQNAVEKQGGELLYESGSAYFKLKKSNNTYYIEVFADGSGMYNVTTIKESSMKQDVVYSAQEINKIINQEGQITFYGIYFYTNKATLKTESDNTLKEIANFLKANKGKQVYIVGHTDNTGNHDYNLKLSKERAETVVKTLVNNFGVSASQLTAEGVGELCPVASNNSEKDKALNRRVVMVLKP
ncbi:OmpA family protein [Marinigracilibium pacificum]|uniref:OmpA family protein n=1 Tax=Marinigracilibium pacificum TaxID=2729599 RepID=A0A848IX45_9BACT|nr:OmpA family protein [Marinigracilibium pacificum]NMM47738.1 OmpA family protein [Marinigracilibium pacificum]